MSRRSARRWPCALGLVVLVLAGVAFAIGALHHPFSYANEAASYSATVLAGRVPEDRLLCPEDRGVLVVGAWKQGLQATDRALGPQVQLDPLRGDFSAARWKVEGAPGLKQARVPIRLLKRKVTFCPDPHDPLGVLKP